MNCLSGSVSALTQQNTKKPSSFVVFLGTLEAAPCDGDPELFGPVRANNKKEWKIGVRGFHARE